MESPFKRPQPTLESVIEALKNTAALEKGIVLIYERQTRDEQREHTTKYDNDRGFEAWAAQKGTRIAEAVKNGARLTEGSEWTTFVRKVLTRNRFQLLEEAWKRWWRMHEGIITTGTAFVIRFGFTMSDNTRIRCKSQLLYAGFEPGVDNHEGHLLLLDPHGKIHREHPSYVFRRTGALLIP